MKEEKSTRGGKDFQFGYPHIEGGISYCCPNERIDYRKNTQKSQNKIGELLINNLKGYIERFGIHTSVPLYPYLQKGRQGIILHLGTGGRWIEVGCESCGFGFVNSHNLDSFIERAVAFNIGSDALEYIDSKMLAPRILPENDSYIIKHYLPRGLDLIPSDHEYLDEESMKRLFKLVQLDEDVRLTLNAYSQEIRNSSGLIKIQNGICETRDFEKRNLPKFSWATARIMALCDKKDSS
jgi:hypothetical protein